MENEQKKQVVFSAIQPSGTITLGNYLGAVRNWVGMQDEYNCIYALADLHTITVRQQPAQMRKNILDAYASIMACGIDVEKSIFFIQSHVNTHAQLAWVLNCYTQFGELSRMTQFKDKSKKNQNFTSGLLTYPVLMAADILAVDSDFVPVGVDQKQHVELARNIAERFNNKFGQTFVVPEPLITKIGTKIMDLQDPTKKMSKSSENQKGVINLLDDEKVIRKKIMSATTDSEMSVKFDPENKKGISNLITIYSAFTEKSIQDIEKEFEGSNYGNFKTKVADIVTKEILEIQKKYYEFLNGDLIDEILDEGKQKLLEITKSKYLLMKQKMGTTR